MLAKIPDIHSWDDEMVYNWSRCLIDDETSGDQDILLKNKICGKKLLILTGTDLYSLGFKKVCYMEILLLAIEKLRTYYSCSNRQTLQMLILNLACQARYLQRQIACETEKQRSQVSLTISSHHKTSPLINGSKDGNTNGSKQRVSLETLNSISSMVPTVTEITNIVNNIQLSKHTELGSIKSLILALSKELAATAQRDQFVENVNDILEKRAKTLADICDRAVQSVVDPLMIQAYYLESITIKKEHAKLLKIITNDGVHKIDEIPPISSTVDSKSLIGDEVVDLMGQNIVGWTAKNVQKLLKSIDESCPLKLIVKKLPHD